MMFKILEYILKYFNNFIALIGWLSFQTILIFVLFILLKNKLGNTEITCMIVLSIGLLINLIVFSFLIIKNIKDIKNILNKTNK